MHRARSAGIPCRADRRDGLGCAGLLRVVQKVEQLVVIELRLTQMSTRYIDPHVALTEGTSFLADEGADLVGDVGLAGEAARSGASSLGASSPAPFDPTRSGPSVVSVDAAC